MSGAIMPAPLAMPLIVTSVSPIFTRCVATFGNVSVVMIARAASISASGLALATRASSTAAIRLASSGSPITPVEAMKTSPAAAPVAARDRLADRGDRARALMPGERVGVAGIDDQRARLAGGKMRAAPVDRRRGAFRAREHARDGRRRVEQRQHHVGAPGDSARPPRRWRSARPRFQAARDISSAQAGRAGRARPWRDVPPLEDAAEASKPRPGFSDLRRARFCAYGFGFSRFGGRRGRSRRRGGRRPRSAWP